MILKITYVDFHCQNKDDLILIFIYERGVCCAVHCYCDIGQATVNQVKKLASAQARQTGEDQGVVTRHLYQRLSVLLTRGNAALLLNRLPTFARPDMDGVE